MKFAAQTPPKAAYLSREVLISVELKVMVKTDIQVDPDGVARQTCNGSKLTPSETHRWLHAHFHSLKQRYDIVIATDEHLSPCILKCKGCGTCLSPIHPWQSTKQHNQSRKCSFQSAEVIDMEQDDEQEKPPKRGRPAQASSSRGSAQPTLNAFMPNAQRQKAVFRSITLP